MIFVKHVYILTFLFNIIESFQKIYKSIFKKQSKNIAFICLSFYADKHIKKYMYSLVCAEYLFLNVK